MRFRTLTALRLLAHYRRWGLPWRYSIRRAWLVAGLRSSMENTQ